MKNSSTLKPSQKYLFNVLIVFVTLTLSILHSTSLSAQCPGSIQLSNPQLCTGECTEATFVGNVAPGTNFSWSVSCGIISNTNNPGPQLACFSNTGMCTITLVVTQPGSPPQSCTATVQIFAKPTMTLNADVTICEGMCTPLVVQATGPNPKMFTLSDGSSTTDYTFNGSTFTLSVCPDETTTYSITQAVSGQCAPYFPNDTKTVTVAPAINASIQQIGDSLKVLPYWMIYQWYDCDDNIINENFYIYHPPASGCYCATLTDPFSGCVEKVCINFVKSCDLTCGIQFQDSICSGQETSFSYTGNAGPNATYNWTINVPTGPPLHFTGPGPIDISYDTAGCYQVILVVSENGCSVDCIDTICVSPGSWNMQVVQQNQTLFALPNDINYTYSWYQCNNPFPLSNGQSFTPDSAGCYCAIMTNLNGCSDTVCVDFPLPCKLTCDFIVADSICLGDSIVITYVGNASSAAVFNWAIDIPGFPGAHYTGAGPIVIPYDSIGCYNVTLTVIDSNCMSICTDSFCVKGKDWDGDIFQGNASLFAIPNSQNYTYYWVDCSGNLLNNNTAILTPIMPGCYCVVITDECGNSESVCVDNFFPCDLTCNLNISDYKLCEGDSVTISYTGNAGPNATYNWTIDLPGNPGLHFIGADPKILKYETAGCYHVSLTVSDSNCTVTCQDSFCVFQVPTAELCCDISSCDTCHILTVNLTGTAPWYIHLDDGTQTDTIGPILSSPFDYQVCADDTVSYSLVGVTDSNNACAGIGTGSVTINYLDYPIASISINGDTLCSINTAFAYGWWNCNIGTYFALTQCVVVNQPGCYCLTLSNNLDCTDSTCVIITKTYDPSGNDKMLLYPVPANNEITIELLNNTKSPDYFEITDLNGRVINKIETPVTVAQNTYKIDLTRYISGMYFVKVHTGDNVITSRFIKY